MTSINILRRVLQVSTVAAMAALVASWLPTLPTPSGSEFVEFVKRDALQPKLAEPAPLQAPTAVDAQQPKASTEAAARVDASGATKRPNGLPENATRIVLKAGEDWCPTTDVKLGIKGEDGRAYAFVDVRAGTARTAVDGSNHSGVWPYCIRGGELGATIWVWPKSGEEARTRVSSSGPRTQVEAKDIYDTWEGVLKAGDEVCSIGATRVTSNKAVNIVDSHGKLLLNAQKPASGHAARDYTGVYCRQALENETYLNIRPGVAGTPGRHDQ